MTEPGDRRELLVLRHAKSAWDTGAASDYERPLARRGERDCPRVGVWIGEQDIVPDGVVASPARRARQTAESVAEAMGFSAGAVEYDDRLYHADLGVILDVLAGCRPEDGRVMIVGHNPGFEHLVLYLARHDVDMPANGKVMPTAALAHFRLPADWSDLGNGCGELVSLTRPRELRGR